MAKNTNIQSEGPELNSAFSAMFAECLAASHLIVLDLFPHLHMEE